MPGQDLKTLLDVARITAQDQGREIVDRPDDGTRLPFERRLAPTDESRNISFNAHEDPVPHRSVTYNRADPSDSHDDSS